MRNPIFPKMKHRLAFKNTTDIPDTMLKRMIAWTMKEMEIPKEWLNQITFRNRSRCFSGRAWWRKGRIVCSIDNQYPRKYSRYGHSCTFETRIEALLFLLAHELFHIHQGRKGLLTRYARREETADLAGHRILKAFRDNQTELLQDWDRRRKTKPKPVVDNELLQWEACKAKLKEWQRKHKLAQTKVKRYLKELKRIEKRILTRSQDIPTSEEKT